MIKLNSNNLSGGIPENIGALSNIDTLWLNNNNLGCYEYNYECDPYGRKPYCCVSHCDDINECSGEIPQSITNLNGLQHLKLKVNNLSGFIPVEIGEMDSLKYLYLDNNQLCPGPSGYPECVPLYQLGLTEDNVIKQDTTNCNE